MTSATEPRVIRQLSASVINKIAAGEVIERPASVLKELLENAVDSGASRIEARLEKGGCDRIRVSDDGCGIPGEQMPLALASHATSKIASADDLFAVGTLGFRGEALASIAEVSQLLIRSRIVQSEVGYEVHVNGGVASEQAPCASAPGTTVEVRNLFFNTPVRRKFMRTVPTELGHASEAFARIALAYPNVHFLLQNNERIIHDLPPVERWRDRIESLFGVEVAESLIWVENDEGPVRLFGYVCDPNVSRSNNKMQYLFINGRHIRDRSLQHALSEAYRGLLLTGRFPISFLRFEMPPDQIDVNVHPTKLEVRFQDGGRLYSQLLSTLRTRFLQTDLTAHVQSSPEQRDPGIELQPTNRAVRGTQPSRPASEFKPYPDAGISTRQADRARADVQQWARQAADGDDRQTSLRFDRPGWTNDPVLPPRSQESLIEPGEGRGRHEAELTSENSPASRHAGGGMEKTRALQAHNRYLVVASDEGLTIIDQHALHERILYEQLRAKVLGGAVEIQRLLTPETVELAPTEAAAVVEHQSVLAEMGLEAESFGGSTILVQGYPAMLGAVDPAELLRQVAAQLVQGDRLPEKRDVLDELLHMMSCKAAIKAGDPLTAPEIESLLEYRHLVQDAHHCPHGRPTTLVFSREELDRRFKRI